MSGSEPEPANGVALFRSVQGALAAERILLDAGVGHKLIAVPRQISSGCGFCLRFSWPDRQRILELLAGDRLGLERIVPL